MRINMPTDEWISTYCGLVMHDEGSHWLLTFWGYPVCAGDEDYCGRALAELCSKMASVIDERDRKMSRAS